LAAAKARNGGRARSDAVAPVKSIVPLWRGAKSADGFAAHQKPSQGVLSPQILEKLWLRFEGKGGKINPNIINYEFEVVLAAGFIE
jgi:hypothetical protein